MSYEVKSLNEECGIFGVWGHPDAASVAYFGLHSLQHRGVCPVSPLGTEILNQ